MSSMKKYLRLPILAFAFISLLTIIEVIYTLYGHDYKALGYCIALWLVYANWFVMWTMYDKKLKQNEELERDNSNAKTILTILINEVGYDLSDDKDHRVEDIVAHIQHLKNKRDCPDRLTDEYWAIMSRDK